MLDERVIQDFHDKFEHYDSIIYNTNSEIEQIEILLTQGNINFSFFYVVQQSPHAPIKEVELIWKYWQQENKFRLTLKYFDYEKPFLDFRPSLKLKYVKYLPEFLKELDTALKEEYKDYIK